MALINFSGIASGIDSNSLIKALLDQQRSARVNPLKFKIQTATDTNSSFDKLSSLITTLSSSLEKFRTLNGGAIAKKVSSSDEATVTATATGSASNGSYSITVGQLAKNATLSLKSSATYSSTSAALGSVNNGTSDADRTASFTIGQGASAETVDIVITDSTTIDDFVSQFNSSTTNAVASAVNVGTSSAPDYRVVITGSNQGLDNGQILVSTGSELSGNNIFNNNLISQATNAEFTISGIGDGGGAATITRSSNSISDVIPGLTFNLNSTNVTPVSVSISDDSSQTSQNLQGFVSAYNDLIKYISEQDAITSEQKGDSVTNIFGPLANTSLDENVISVLRGAFTSASTSGREVNTLADLGITTDRDGTLKFDSNVLTAALANDSDGVRLITQNLGDALGGIGGSLAQFTQFGGLIDSAQNSNKNQITDLNSRISTIEQALSRQEQTLTSQYARLESLIGQLNSTQSTLAQLLPR